MGGGGIKKSVRGSRPRLRAWETERGSRGMPGAESKNQIWSLLCWQQLTRRSKCGVLGVVIWATLEPSSALPCPQTKQKPNDAAAPDSSAGRSQKSHGAQ